MFILTIKRNYEKSLLAVFIGILIFSLIGSISSTPTAETAMMGKHAYAEDASNIEDFSSIRSFNANLEDTIKKNDTIIIDLSNGSDRIREMESAFNMTNNPLFSRNQVKNETDYQFNLTNFTSSLTGSSDSASRVTEIAADFNGDDFEDKAIGVPLEDLETNSGVNIDIGVVHVVYGSPDGLLSSDNAIVADQLLCSFPCLTAGIRLGTFFGSSLSAGDYNGDGHDDLAIGAPGDDHGGVMDTGRVTVIYGAPWGLSTGDPNVLLPFKFGQEWVSQGVSDERAETEDRFGESLSSGDYNGDGHDDLAIGVPHEDNDAANGGVVHVIYGTPQGLKNPFSGQFKGQLWKQIMTDNEHDDLFGYPLSSGDYNGDNNDDLVIGITREDIGNVSNSGAVTVIYGSAGGLSVNHVTAGQQWTQLSTDNEDGDLFGYSLSSGDYNGDNHDDLAIGVPEEDLGTVINAGDVHVIYGSPSGLSATAVLPLQIWTQNSNLEDSSEQEDLFGHSLSSGDYNGDNRDDLAIGAPGENIWEGKVHVVYGFSSGLSHTLPITNHLWMQGSGGLFNVPSSFDRFGYSLSSGDYNGDQLDELTIGVPGEGPDAGIIHILDGSSLGLSPKTDFLDQIRAQGVRGLADRLEDNDQFGLVQ